MTPAPCKVCGMNPCAPLCRAARALKRHQHESHKRPKGQPPKLELSVEQRLGLKARAIRAGLGETDVRI